MHAAIRERVVFRNIILLFVGLACIWITHRLRIEEAHKFIIDLLILILATCLGLWMEYTIVPPLFRRKELRRLITEAAEAAEQSGTLQIVFAEIVQQLRQNLGRVKAGFFTDQNDTVPDLSLHTVNAIERCAFATFVADEREAIYNTPAGLAYIQAWYAKAEALGPPAKKKPGGPHPLHRVFIVDHFDRTDGSIVDLIQDHISHNIQVSVVERRTAESLAAVSNVELDFGLFDDTCLMTVKAKRAGFNKLTVFVALSSGENADHIARYQKFKSKLINEAKTGVEFLADFQKPPNANFWAYRFREHGVSLGPPHGLSQLDAKQMLDFVFRKLPVHREPVRIAILGLTPVLVNTCESNDRIAEVILVDQSTFESDMPKSSKIKRVHCNWLTFNAHSNLDAILGDESLNNLSISQYRSFFRAMHSSLRPGGVLIMRTLGRFGDTEQYLDVPPQKLLDYAKTAISEETELKRAETIIGFLHSREIAYNDEIESIETARYNGLLQKWCKNRDLSKQQAEECYFPEVQPKLSIEFSFRYYHQPGERWLLPRESGTPSRRIVLHAQFAPSSLLSNCALYSSCTT